MNVIILVLDEAFPDDSAIPWHLLPRSADYLRKVMEVTGYDSKEAILRLRSKDELKRMFDFAIDIGINFDEIEASIFGVFKNSPEKLQLLPGLQTSFVVSLMLCRVKVHLQRWRH